MIPVRRAIWYAVLNQGSLVMVGFVSVAVLARLLTPAEIGVFAVASSISFVASSIRSFGVGDYLIREAHIDKSSVSSVIGVMMVMSWSLGLILIASAPLISSFFDVPDLRDVIWIMSGPFFLAPYITVPHSLLGRELRFDSTLRVDLAGALTNAVVSIALALWGLRYFGLAIGALLGVVAEFIVVTLLRPNLMTWKPSLSKFSEIFRAGFFISTGRALTMVSENSSDLILGRMSQMNIVGLFSRGLGLILFVQRLMVQSVGRVALPHLSQVNRSGGDVAEAYLTSVSLVGAVTMPVFAVINLAAKPMIIALFGDQWTASVEVASILALWATLQAVHSFSNPALLATGRERVVLLKELTSITVKIGVVVAAVPHGLIWVAWAFVISGAFDFVLSTLIMHLTHGITISRLISAYASNVVVAAVCWISLKGVSRFVDFDSMNSWLAVLLIGCAMTPVWLASIYLTRNKAWPFVRDIASQGVRRLLPQRSDL